MKQNLFLIVISIAVVSLIIMLNLFLQQSYLSKMAEQFKREQLILANTTAKNISGRFGHLTDEMLLLAGILGGKGLGPAGMQKAIKTFFNGMDKEALVGLTVYEPAAGGFWPPRPIWSSLPRPRATPVDLALIRRTMSMNPAKVLYSDALIFKKGIIKLYMPVFSGGRWRGAIGLDASLDSIDRAFLAPVRFGNKGYAWMMNEDGTLLYHPSRPGMIGRNLYRASGGCFACHKSFNTERWILRSGPTGASSYIAPFGEDKLIAFSKLSVFGRKWIVCTTIPYSEVTSSLRGSLKLQSILMLVVFGAAFSGATMLVVLNMKRTKAEEKAKREEDLEKYTALLEKTVLERTEELFAEKEKLNSIVNAVGGGLVLTGVDEKIIWANKQFSEMAGFDAGEISRHTFSPDCTAVSSHVSDGIETSVFEGLFGRKGRFFQVTSAPVRSEGGVLGFIKLVQDITEMKKMEEQVLNTVRLSEVGRLTAGICHEIGNPLTAVFSFLQILRDMEDEGFKKESIESMLFHISRIAETVRQLSTISKVAPPAMKKVNINLILGQAMDLMKYDKRAVKIDFMEEFEEIADIITDENRVSQVFINIMLNAMDAMPEGGTLTVRSKAQADGAAVEIEDTGVGISQEDMPYIFESFFTTKEKGTGLGLYVSHGIIRGLGGELRVESSPGAGTRFTVIIPAGRNLRDADQNIDS
ncbi:MAG: ATP-binding protein [Nitrospiraceae bacterium]|nr:ATP-binding protein [Nitrospiraceae bacterium]